MPNLERSGAVKCKHARMQDERLVILDIIRTHLLAEQTDNTSNYKAVIHEGRPSAMLVGSWSDWGSATAGSNLDRPNKTATLKTLNVDLRVATKTLQSRRWIPDFSEDRRKWQDRGVLRVGSERSLADDVFVQGGLVLLRAEVFMQVLPGSAVELACDLHCTDKP